VLVWKKIVLESELPRLGRAGGPQVFRKKGERKQRKVQKRLMQEMQQKSTREREASCRSIKMARERGTTT
jgi:hypothetical protein